VPIWCPASANEAGARLKARRNGDSGRGPTGTSIAISVITMRSRDPFLLFFPLTALLLLLGCSSAGDAKSTEHAAFTEQAVAIGSSNLGTGSAVTVPGDTYQMVDVAALSSARFVTAGKVGTAQNGDLGLTLWRRNTDDTVSVLSSTKGPGRVSNRVSVARIDDSTFLVATRDQNGRLEVLAFQIDGSDQIVQTDRQEFENVTDVWVTAMNYAPGAFPFSSAGLQGQGHAVVAYRNSGGNLAVQDFSVSDTGAVTANGSALAGAVPAAMVAYVPGTQPPGASFSQIVSPHEDRCVNSTDDDGDGYVDCADWDCCGRGVCDGVGICQQGMVVTANYNNSSSFKLISWNVSARGAITRASDTLAGSGLVDITPLSFHRFATLRVFGSGAAVETWDVDGTTGAITLHSTATLFNPDINILPVPTWTGGNIVNGGGARLFVQVADSRGVGQLWTFDAIDQLRVVEQGQLPTAPWTNHGSMISLSQDHVVLAIPGAGDTLYVQSYRDFSMPLLHGSFSFSSTNASTPANNTSAFNFLPVAPSSNPIGFGPDSGIAVSDTYALACGGGQFAIFDKAGTNITPGTNLSYSSLFNSVIAGRVGGARNEQSIRRHLAFQHRCDADSDPSTADGARNGCLNQLFDARCTFDPVTQRFVVVVIGRYENSRSPYKDNMQRYSGIAVSKQADPRQGFNIYMTTDNKYDDNPMIAANGSLVFVQQFDSSDVDAHRDEVLAPAAFVYDIADMAAGRTDVHVSKLSIARTRGRRGLKVANSIGAGQYSAVYFLQSDGYQPFVFRKMGDGPINPATNLFNNSLHVSPGPSTEGDSTNGLLQMDSTTNGSFYVIDRYSPDGLNRIRMNRANISVTPSPSGAPLLMSMDSSVSSDAFGCDSNHECQLAAMGFVRPAGGAVGSGSVYATYARYDVRYAACPAGVSCSSGICIDSTCQPTPNLPGIFYTRFTESLDRVGGITTIIRGSVVPTDGATPNLNLGFSQVASDPTNGSIWYINDIPTSRRSDGTTVWQYAAGQTR